MRLARLTPTAQRDFDLIVWHSEENFGTRAADRYRRLIDTAVRNLAADPDRTGTRRFQGDVRLYPLRMAARRMAAGVRVRAPVHVIAYRFDDEKVEIIRVLHEAMDIPRHLEMAIAPESLDYIRDDRARDDPSA